MAKSNETAAGEKATPATPEESGAPQVQLVKMVRPQPQFPGGPITADVHPDEVANYLAGGWSVEK
ncbi:MAG TPA: hypothetical protein VJ302_30680 [Blastocatellia bacterium]|nr:hypothetical protein [Blastocatellia bacterium]